MKRFLTLLAAGALLFQGLSAQTRDPYAALGEKLDAYTASLAAEPAGIKNGECDFLISACQDSLVRQYTALHLYQYYLNSRVLGDDAVAVHLADEWFLSGKVAMQSETDLLNARIFADFNRSSLIGKPAPELTLKDTNGQEVTLPAASDGKYAVLYFYDTGCSSCKVESALLRQWFARQEHGVALYAIYTGDDEAAWGRYRVTELVMPGAVHLWDPGMDSDFQQKYGILQTPGMFLVAPNGTIAGRGLDTVSLQALLEQRLGEDEYVYGGDRSKAMFDEVFATYGDTLRAGHVLTVARYSESQTLAVGDTLNYKHLTGDLLYYLSSRRGEAFHTALPAFIDGYVRRDGIWTSRNDTLQVVSLADMLHDLSDKSPVGSEVAPLRLHGTLRRYGRTAKDGVFALRKLKGDPAYLVFYTAGCSNCREMRAEVNLLVGKRANRKVRVLLVDMDALFNTWPEEAKAALDAFDLSALPFIVQVGRHGIIQRKYLTSF